MQKYIQIRSNSKKAPGWWKEWIFVVLIIIYLNDVSVALIERVEVEVVVEVAIEWDVIDHAARDELAAELDALAPALDQPLASQPRDKVAAGEHLFVEFGVEALVARYATHALLLVLALE